MTLELISTYAAALALLIGSVFVILGVIGLLKFATPMTRLHAPTKISTLGIGMMLTASALAALASGRLSFHELLILAFLFVTAPISAHFIAKVSLHRRECEAPPPPAEDETWAALAPADEDREG